MPPITAKYGIIPDLSVYKIFGCIVYVHIPKETRSKGFVDKAYRGFFLGINLKTSTYMGYVIELDKVVDDSSMIFDKTMTNQLSNSVGILEFATDSASIKDYMYMIDMIYRDTEDNLLYVTTRVVVRGGLLVAFRALFLSGVVGQEDPRPIHVADVAKMIDLYHDSKQPIIMIDGSPTTVEVATDNSNEDAKAAEHAIPTSLDDEIPSGAPMEQHGSEPPNEGMQPLGKAHGTADESAMGSLPEGRPTSVRFRKKATHINVGTLGDVSHLVYMNMYNDEYVLNMQDLKLSKLPEDQRALLLNLDDCSKDDKDEWLAADIREL
jgi:hypothetical protein